MDFSSFSNQQLEANLRDLRGSGGPHETIDRLQEAVQELQVLRIELEMQNRALRETQGELEFAMRRYSDLYDHLPVGYVTVGSDGQIVQANLAAAELLQRDRAGLVGTYLRSFFDAYDAGRFVAHLENCTQTGRPATIDLTLRLKDGSTMTVQLSSRLAPGATNGTRYVHIAITDVSKLKQAQRLLEDINREQETFNYSISHDLRGPLVSISNYARIVLGEHAVALNDESKMMLQRIESAAARVQHTLKHLLEYNTVMREELAFHEVDVDEIVRGVLTEQRNLIQECKAEVAVDRPLPVVRASRAMLSCVLAKLLTNALTYTKDGAVPHVRIRAEATESRVVIRISDDGIGIDPRHQERIFSVFERLHGYSQYAGAGIGLAIARRAAERMNGRIWVQSELGQGSCFCVELPKD